MKLNDIAVKFLKTTKTCKVYVVTDIVNTRNNTLYEMKFLHGSDKDFYQKDYIYMDKKQVDELVVIGSENG